MLSTDQPRPTEVGPAEAVSAHRGGPGELLPWLAVGAFALQGLRPLSDPDTWWHLRTGQRIVSQHRIPTADHWSYASSRPWVAHEWLSEVLFYLGFRAGGYSGIQVLHVLLLAAVGTVLVRECRRRGNWLHTSIAALFGLTAVAPGAAARPQLASVLLMAVFGPALLRAAERRRPPLWFIPLIWLWANLHGLWTIALVLYAAVTVGLAIGLRGRGLPVLARFAGVGAGMLVAAALTPVGPRLLLAPLAVHDVTRYVTEWQRPRLTSPGTAAALVLVAVVLIRWARSSRQVRAAEVAYVLVAAGLALAYVRTGPLAGVLLAPLAAGALAGIFDEPVTAARLTPRVRAARAVLVVLISALGILSLIRLPSIKPPAPAAATRVIDALPGHPRVLTDPDLGNWLLWTSHAASPGLDGRYEIFAPDYLRRYVDALALEGDWRGFVASSRAGVAWLHAGTPLASGLREQLHWTVAWSDGSTVILRAPAP